MYEPLSVQSFECEIKISMTCDKTKQLLCILKWQALVVTGQDNWCRIISYKLGDTLAKVILKQLTFVCRLQKFWKASKNLKKEQSIYFWCFFLALFICSYYCLMQLEQRRMGGALTTNVTFKAPSNIYTVVSFWIKC